MMYNFNIVFFKKVAYLGFEIECVCDVNDSDPLAIKGTYQWRYYHNE